jgi:hypothetical protein
MSERCTAFEGTDLLASGSLPEVALAVRAALRNGATKPLLTFDDATGQVIDLDLRGEDGEILDRRTPSEPSGSGPARGRGRPKLGVIAREVTLLPRHWEWLSAQTGGASVALRRLVEEARRDDGGRQQRRARQERAYRFMAAMAGDLPGFEEACRALFADQSERFQTLVADWPAAVRTYANRLAFGSTP